MLADWEALVARVGPRVGLIPGPAVTGRGDFMFGGLGDQSLYPVYGRDVRGRCGRAGQRPSVTGESALGESRPLPLLGERAPLF